MIYQEPTLFPDLSVTENIFMGRQLLGSGRRIDRGAMYAEAERSSPGSGVHIDPRRPALGLSIADQQIIEIAKAISLDARVLIMDEPTAALSGVEVERLFTVARRLRDEGRALVFISHRFDEVFELCDTVTVMRDGAYVDTLRVADTDVDKLVALMVGREVGDLFPKTPATVGEPGARGAQPRVHRRLPRRQLRGPRRRDRRPRRSGRCRSQRDRPRRVRRRRLRLRLGERCRQARCRRATRAPRSGPAWRSSPRTAASRASSSTRRSSRNVAGVIRGRLSRGWASSPNAPRARPPRPWAARLEVKTNALDMNATTMSGGNQQKVVIAKWLATEPRLLIIDEPTRGIDVGTKAEVHRLLSELAGQGMAILMISSELPEVLGMADRVLVVCEGRLTADIDRDDATPENVMRAATQTREVRA